MTSSIDTSLIDSSKPDEGNPTTASVRSNVLYIKAALNSAKAEIETLQTDVSSLNSAMRYMGGWDASAGTFPSGAQKGYVYSVSVAGTVGGMAFDITDRINCIVNSASTTVYAGNWLKEDYTDRVLSVNGQTGEVIITNISGNAATVTTNANLTGEVTSTGNATTLSNAAVIAKVLTGFVSGVGAVSAADTILSALQKIVANLALKLTANSAITASTRTKITYDANGLVTSGADATTADIADSTNKRYLTDSEKTILTNTSGTNSGDETGATIKTKIGVLPIANGGTGISAQAAWSAWTPTISGFTLNNGTMTGRYYQDPLTKTVFGSLDITWGTTTVLSGFLSVPYPIAPRARNQWSQIGKGAQLATNLYALSVLYFDSTNMRVAYNQVSGSAVLLTSITSSLPATLANGNTLSFTFCYEAG